MSESEFPDCRHIFAGIPAGTEAAPHTVILSSSVTIDTESTDTNADWAKINSLTETAGKYVVLDLSACTVKGNTMTGAYTGYTPPTGNKFNIIYNNIYIKGIILPDALTSIGSSTFKGCTGLTSVTFEGADTVITSGNFAAFPDGVSLLSRGGATASPYKMAAGTYTRSGTTWTKQP